MNKLSKEKRDRLILVAAVTAIVIVSLWFLIIGQQRDTLAEIDGKSQKLSSSITKAEGVIKTGAEVEKRLSERLEALKLKESEMAPEDDPYAWMLDIMTHSCQGRIAGWQLDKPEFQNSLLLPDSSYRSAVFHFKGSGFFNVVGKFIADFENAHRLFQIRNLTLTPASSMPMVRSGAVAAGDEETLSVDFYIVTPVRPVEAPPTTK